MTSSEPVAWGSCYADGSIAQATTNQRVAQGWGNKGGTVVPLFATSAQDRIDAAAMRDAFESFHAHRKNKGAARRERLFERLPDDSYVDPSVQRHWWTWQSAMTEAKGKT